MTHVCFVDQSGSLGGAELMLLDLIQSSTLQTRVIVLEEGPFPDRLRSAKVTTDIVPLGKLAAGVTKQATIQRALRSIPGLLGCAKQIAALASRSDLIYANTQKALVVSMLASMFRRKPVIFHLHDLLTASHFSAANRRVAVVLMNRCDAVICNSNATLEAYLQSGGRPKSHHVVYNGFQPTMTNTGSSRAEVRRELGIRDDAFVVGAFGRLAAWKGQRVLLDATEKSVTAVDHVLMVGEALYTDDDRRYAASLKQQADCGTLRERVNFLGHRDDVPALMMACDVIVHTSTQPEPFGRVIVEGMLAGKPVIATNAGGVPEIIQHDVDGLLVPPGDADALATALRRLSDDPALRMRLAKAGMQKAIEKFSTRQMVDGVEKVIQEVIEGSRKRKLRP